MEELTKMKMAKCLAMVSEPEIQMIIQSLIEDTGSVDRAEKWINRKITQVHHDIMIEGLNEYTIQQRDEWTNVERYFKNRRNEIVRSQTTPNKFWPH
jgi:hypothetical protein